MSQYLKSALQPGCLVVALSFASVSGVNAQADGPLDALMMLAGTARPDVAAIEKISNRNGAIATVRAVADNGAVSVRGSVRKTGFGPVTTANSHIDVVVLDSQGKVVWKTATAYFPSQIPYTIRSVEGRSRFSVNLPRPLPAGATIQVVFDDGPAPQGYYHKQG